MAGKRSTDTAHSNDRHVRVLDESNDPHCIAMTVHDKIHVYEGNVRKTIVRCPETPSTFELYKDQEEQWVIWVATHDGNIYRKGLQSASKSDNGLMETDSGSNQSIFDDLLSENDPDFTDCSAEPCQLPSLCELNENDKVLSCSMDVKRISCTKDILAVVCAETNETVMLIYSMSALLSNLSSEIIVRLPLPSCSFPSLKKSACQFSKLTVVTSEKNCLSSSQVSVPSHLFSLLFGWEASVRSLSAAVCSMSDGSVYFHPLDLAVRNPQVTWQLLCMVDSPVVDLLSLRLNRTMTERESVAAKLHNAMGLAVRTPSHTVLDAFLVVGASGKCCLTTAMPALESAAFSADCRKVVTMFTLPGSVGSACWRDNALYVCSPSHHIQKCQLTLVRQGGGEKEQFGVEVKAEHVYSASVSLMWFSGEGKSLVCQTVNGDLIEIDSEPATDQSPQSTVLPPQSSLKDLLLGVDMSQASLNQLKSAHTQHNAFLQQMNVAAHLLHQNRHQQIVGSHNTGPINCKLTVQSETSYSGMNYNLLLEVDNSSTVSLTKDWSVVVILREVTGRQDPKQADLRGQSSTHSFPLVQNLEAGRQVCFKIPVSYCTDSCGTKVDVSLVLRIPENLQEDFCVQYAFRDCLFVPVAASVVDVFHFLQLKQAGNGPPPTADPQTCVERKVAELKCSGQSTCLSERKTAGQIYCISECISAENASVSPVETLRLLLRGSQVKTEQVQHASCTLQAPCGSVLTISVEPAPPSNTSPRNSEDGKTHTISLKSACISLLARARLALTRRLQVIGNTHRGVSVEEFRKMIRRAESFQQQLQKIQSRWEKGDNTFPSTSSDVCALYEAIQNDIL